MKRLGAKTIYEKGRILLLIACLAFLPALAGQPAPAAAAAQSDAVKVDLVIDGQLLRSEEQAIVTQGRTLIPLRVLMETLGARVEWSPETRTVTITRGAGSYVKLWIDNRLVCYGDAAGESYDVCDVAPRIVADRTYVPLRLLAGALGIGVEWDNQNGQVRIDTTAAGERTRFFDVTIQGVQPGQQITGALPLSLLYGNGAPQDAVWVKYLLLDPVAGDGKIAASTSHVNGAVTLIPDVALTGPAVLAAAVCDKEGNFLAGAAVNVHMQPVPSVRLEGIGEGQVMTGEIQMRAEVSFRARGLEYEFSVLSDGSSTRSPQTDPEETYTHIPPAGQNGPIAIRAIAYDSAGNAYPSAAVTVMASVPPEDTTPRVNLRSFNAEHVGKIPVTLSITRNFDSALTQYWAQNVAGGESVLLDEKPWGDAVWFPGPDMAGTWDIYVQVTDPRGNVYTSNTRRVSISSAPSLILGGVGPGQVITGGLTLHSTANVPLAQVEYILSNPFNGSQRSLGTAENPSQEIEWTPESVNEGERQIRAVGTLPGGQQIESEVIPVKIYFGQFYNARPVIERGQFVNMVTPMALATQKQNGMSAALQIAQAILETGWGQSLPVDRYSGLFSYNLFGIKGTGPAGSVLSGTQEEYYGTLYRTDANFRAYHSVQESWNDHNDLLLQLERYQPYRNVMYHSVSGAFALKRCGYATDSAYPDKLITIINQYGLDKLDRQNL